MKCVHGIERESDETDMSKYINIMKVTVTGHINQTIDYIKYGNRCNSNTPRSASSAAI